MARPAGGGKGQFAWRKILLRSGTVPALWKGESPPKDPAGAAPMSSQQEKPLDLSPLSDKYEIVGEYAALGQNRRYPRRRRDDGRHEPDDGPESPQRPESDRGTMGRR